MRPFLVPPNAAARLSLALTSNHPEPRNVWMWHFCDVDGGRSSVRNWADCGSAALTNSLQLVERACQKAVPGIDRIRLDEGAVPVVANGGIGDTTGTVLPFGEERQQYDSPSNLGHL